MFSWEAESMKKIIIFALLALLIVTVIIVLVSLSNPLRKPQEEIMENILTLTPIGTSKDDVIKVIEENEQWYKNYKYLEQYGKYEHYDRGYLMRNGYPVMAYGSFKNLDETDIVGKETIKATIGQYTRFINVTVFAYWAFDEDAKLVDVAIMKGSSSI